MNHPFEQDDIIKFIRGELTVEEGNAIEREMKSNQFLADDVRNIRLSLSVIDRGGEQLLKQRFKKLEKRNAVKKWIYILLVVVSVIVIGIAIKKGFSKEEPPKMQAIYASNYQKYRPPVTIRNGENNSTDMSSAIAAYGTADYDKAFEVFNSECSDSNQEACFYAVLSSLYAGNLNYQNAKRQLTENSAYIAIVLWYEALNSLHLNKKEEAIIYIEELSEMGTFKKDESLEILMQLRQMEK